MGRHMGYKSDEVSSGEISKVGLVSSWGDSDVRSY